MGALALTLSGYAQPRLMQTINSQWDFYQGDFASPPAHDVHALVWTRVSLPHTWNDRDTGSDGARGYYRGPGWYRKYLTVQATPNARFFLHFEGANQETTVFVNGQHVGDHKGGYSAFTFDITPYLAAGNRQELLVRVTNEHNPLIAPLSADFTFFGGIYRDVFLIQTEAHHFVMDDHGAAGVYVSTPEVSESAARLQVRGGVVIRGPVKDARIRTQVISPAGQRVSNFEQKIKAQEGKNHFSFTSPIVSPVALWSPDQPSLYRVIVELVINRQVTDRISLPLGFRWFHFDAKEGFFLNGKHLKLMGANRHQDVYGLGHALRDEQHRADLMLLKQMGANFIRLAHYPQDPAVLQAADELGLLVWEETPLVNEVTLDERHHQQAEVMLREMIRQHYHHPSVILWGYMNEIYWAHRFLPSERVEAHTRETVMLAKRLEQVARTEDPTRYTAMAMHNYPLYEESGIDSLPQVAGWNLYHGWYYDELEDFGKFMDRQHQKYPNRPHIISEYGAGADTRLHTTRPEKFDFSIQFQKKFHESFFQQIMERPYLAGAAVWNLIDFSSERRIDATPHLNNKGLANYQRQPKDAYFFYQAALRQEPFIKIAETTWLARSGAADAAAATFPIQVYSNQPEAELTHNGQSLGKKDVTSYQAVWPVTLTDGINVLEARAGQHIHRIEISYRSLPSQLNEGFDVLAINAGSHCDYIEPVSGQQWLRDTPYQPGGWGYRGGRPLYVGNKIGSKEDILTTDDDPLYQTMRMGMHDYQFDVAPGRYEVELLFVDPYPVSRRFVDGAESPRHEGGLRIFDVLINGITYRSQLDLTKELGYNYPLREKFIVEVQPQTPLLIAFRAQKGDAVISGIKIKSLGR